MGVREDTDLSILSNTYGFERHPGHASLVRAESKPLGHVRYAFIFFNFALAKRNLPAIIWCFVGRDMAGDRVRLTFLCQQCDIAP